MIKDEYIDYIEKRISESNIKNKELRDDLVDHFCCIVEIEMKKGLSFEQAYQKAFLQTSPNGFDEIQNETLFLLNYNKIMNLKRLTYLSGYLFSAAWIIGIAFKILHLPGAMVVLMVGAAGLAFFFIPLLLINKFKQDMPAILSEKLKWIFGGASVMLTVISIAMKLAHWQGASIMLGISFLILSFGFLPFLFFRMYKKSVDELVAE